jgi:transcriptional regulator GlxA family with amidase domain
MLLQHGDAPLAHVAALAGYADQSHLTRELRRFLLATPAHVRRGAGRVVQVSPVQDGGAAPV